MSKDDELKQAVLAELNWQPSVTAAHIGVAVHNGIVTLTGHVTSLVEKITAEVATSQVKGVKAVAEEIEVRLPCDDVRGDEEIAAIAIERLSWNSLIPESNIKIRVEKGKVTLTGDVDWHYQKEDAENDIVGLMGVTQVVNQIMIKPLINPSNISDDIMHALHRIWLLDPKRITVNAKDGIVTLKGTVHSWQDRRLAEDTAWASPGVTGVENNIAIDW